MNRFQKQKLFLNSMDQVDGVLLLMAVFWVWVLNLGISARVHSNQLQPLVQKELNKITGRDHRSFSVTTIARGYEGCQSNLLLIPLETSIDSM